VRYFDDDGPRAVLVTKEDPLSIQLDLLRGFQNMKRLSFRHSIYAVHDKVMQLILKEMTSL